MEDRERFVIARGLFVEAACAFQTNVEKENRTLGKEIFEIVKNAATASGWQDLRSWIERFRVHFSPKRGHTESILPDEEYVTRLLSILRLSERDFRELQNTPWEQWKQI